MPVPVSSSVKKASTRIVLGQKGQYPYRPRSKRPVPVSSLVKKASTRIVLGQKGQYQYRPRSKRPVPVSSPVKKTSTRMVIPIQTLESRMFQYGILPVWARQNKGQYPYRPQSKRPVPALTAQYPHGDFAHMGTYTNIMVGEIGKPNGDR